MKFKLGRNIFLASVGATALIPSLSCCAPAANKTVDNKLPVQNEQEETHEACTITYIGADCTPDGNAIIARATDCDPKAVHLKLKYFYKDEKANKLIEGKNGLKYQMPEHTYAYTSCPLSDKTSDDVIWGNELWENNAINEMGVGVTCTLTCHGRDVVVGEGGFDPFVASGIGEELLTAIIAPQATSARHAMEIAAKAVDDFGNQDANIIMACDQKEAWLMEMYSGRQYCAIKLPTDKVCVAGNEFILDSLIDLGINSSNANDMCIMSPNLYKLATEKGFAVYKEGTLPADEDVYHLDLFKTYSRPLCTKIGDVEETNTDSSHMRTWRGYSLFDKSSTSEGNEYHYDKKYAPFFVPKDKNGNVRKDFTARDVFEVYRDEYDEIVNDPTPAEWQQRFIEAKSKGQLRTIAVERTRAVHIMSSDKNLPKEICANEWYTPSSANYTPFLQINNGMTSVEGEFGYYPDRFNYDEDCSSVLFRELNKLAWGDRVNYGYPIQDFWRIFENVYDTEMTQVVNDASKLSLDDAKNVITNFNKHVRDIYISAVKNVKNDLMWHIMDQPSSKPAFIPLIDLESFVNELGWTNYKFDGQKATFERNENKCEYSVSSGLVYATGVLKVNDKTYELKDSVKDNKVYVDLATLNDAIASLSEIRTININDYLKNFNHLIWIVPVAAIAAAGIAVGTFFLVKKKKEKKAVPAK